MDAFKSFHEDTINKKFDDPKITVGIESNLDCKKKSFKNDIDHFISEDVENLEFKLKIKFNLILILDVFEHLIHPWKVFNQFSNHLEKD